MAYLTENRVSTCRNTDGSFGSPRIRKYESTCIKRKISQNLYKYGKEANDRWTEKLREKEQIT